MTIKYSCVSIIWDRPSKNRSIQVDFKYGMVYTSQFILKNYDFEKLSSTDKLSWTLIYNKCI